MNRLAKFAVMGMFLSLFPCETGHSQSGYNKFKPLPPAVKGIQSRTIDKDILESVMSAGELPDFEVDIIGLKDHPELIASGELFRLEGRTIKYRSAGDFNYFWSKGPLEWSDDYEGDQEITVPDLNQSPVFVSGYIDIPFDFRFYNYYHTKLRIDRNLSILFDNKNEKTASGLCLMDSGPIDFKSCNPMIITAGGGLISPVIAKIKKSQDFLRMTFVNKTADPYGLNDIQMQVTLYKDGGIDISYKRYSNPYLTSFVVGLAAGKAETYLSQDFNNPGLNYGSTSESSPTGIVGVYKGVKLNREKIIEIILNKYPLSDFDAIMTATDIAIAEDVVGTNLGSSLGASASIYYNDVSGTGYLVSDCKTQNCDQIKKFTAYINLNYVSHYDSQDDFAATIFHEFGHKWMSFVDNAPPKQTCESVKYVSPSCHWIYPHKAAFNKNCVSVMYNSYGTAGKCVGLSYIDLYLMGLCSKEEAMAEFESAINDIVGKHGEREPSYWKAKKKFYVRPLIVTKLSAEEFKKGYSKVKFLYAGALMKFAKMFKEASFNRGSVQFAPPAAITDIGYKTAIIRMKDHIKPVPIVDFFQTAQ